jgi:hypothetical protein
VQFGDENSKFFHAMATERYRKNVICQILDDTRRTIIDHTEKSTLFYNEFKRRLGTSVEIPLQFDLHSSFLLITTLTTFASPSPRRKLIISSKNFPMIRPQGLMVLTTFFQEGLAHHQG